MTALLVYLLAHLIVGSGASHAEQTSEGVRFFEQKIRPLLVDYCYECHSEEAGEQQAVALPARQRTHR